MAAAAGGFTAVACMANTDPVNDNRSVTEHILAEARRHGYARVYPIGACRSSLRRGAGGDRRDGAGRGGGGLGRRPAGDERRADAPRPPLRQHFAIPVIQHAEDLHLAALASCTRGVVDQTRPPRPPRLREDVMVARDLILQEDAGGRYHVAHLSTAAAWRWCSAARRRFEGHLRGGAPSPAADRRGGFALGLSTNTKMKPPCAPKPTPGAPRRPRRRHGRLHRERPRPSPCGREGRRVQPRPLRIWDWRPPLLCLDRLVRPGS